MLLSTTLALLITGCAQQTFTVQNNGSSSTKTITHFLRFWNWAEENCRLQPKFVAAQKMLLKQKPSKHSTNGLLGFITRHLSPLEARVCAHNNCMSCPSIWATLSALLINILLGSLSCFCIVISLSLRVK